MIILTPGFAVSSSESGRNENSVRNPSPYVFGPEGVIDSKRHVPGMSRYWQPLPTGLEGAWVSQLKRSAPAKRHAKISLGNEIRLTAS
jgi:hypothetical protein